MSRWPTARISIIYNICMLGKYSSVIMVYEFFTPTSNGNLSYVLQLHDTIFVHKCTYSLTIIVTGTKNHRYIIIIYNDHKIYNDKK